MSLCTPHDLKDRSSERNCEAQREFQALIKGEGLGMWMYYIKEIVFDVFFDVL